MIQLLCILFLIEINEVCESVAGRSICVVGKVLFISGKVDVKVNVTRKFISFLDVNCMVVDYIRMLCDEKCPCLGPTVIS